MIQQIECMTIVLITVINFHKIYVVGEFFPLRKGRDDNERNYTSSATITDFNITGDSTTPMPSADIIGTSEYPSDGIQLHPSASIFTAAKKNVTTSSSDDTIQLFLTTSSSISGAGESVTEIISSASTINITGYIIENDDADTSKLTLCLILSNISSD